MAKKLVTVLGWIFIVIGVLGFIPGITSDGMLIGVFEVDAVHNIVHLITGILAVWLARKGEDSARSYAKVFGVIYAVVTLWGLLISDSVLGFINVNGLDNILHLVVAVLFLWVGFAGRKEMAASMGSSM